MEITDLPYDIHTTILPNIYSVEDYINYCEAANIECDIKICGELKKRTYKSSINADLKICYFKINDTQYIAWHNYGIISLSLCNIEEQEMDDDFTMIDRKYFDGEEIYISDIEILRTISQYLCGVLSINVEKIITEKIDDELELIIKNLNILGYFNTDNILFAYDIGLFKMTLICDFDDRSYKRMHVEYDGTKPYKNIDVVEYVCHNCYYDHSEECCPTKIIIKCNNVPKLKFVECYDSHKIIEINIPNVFIKN